MRPSGRELRNRRKQTMSALAASLVFVRDELASSMSLRELRKQRGAIEHILADDDNTRLRGVKIEPVAAKATENATLVDMHSLLEDYHAYLRQLERNRQNH